MYTYLKFNIYITGRNGYIIPIIQYKHFNKFNIICRMQNRFEISFQRDYYLQRKTFSIKHKQCFLLCYKNYF